MPLKHHWPPGKILPIQEVLPKNPRLKDLPRIPSNLLGERNCPILIYCVWKSGKHAAVRVACESWKCPYCSRTKVDEIAQIIADMTIDQSVVFDIICNIRQKDTILKKFRKEKISALSLKLSGEHYIMASDFAEGRTWKLEEISRTSALAKLYRINSTGIFRRDFIGSWRPEEKFEPKRDTVVYSTRFGSIAELQETLAGYGLDINSEFVDRDPLDVMEAMTKMRSDYTIVFDDIEQLVGDVDHEQ